MVTFWQRNLLGYLSLDTICSSRPAVFFELRSRRGVRLSEQIMVAGKCTSVFSRQKETTVFIFTSYVSWINSLIFLLIAVENDVDKTRPEMATGKTNWVSSIGHLRVTLCLGFKTSLRVKPFIWNDWFAWKYTSRRNKFPYEWFCAKSLLDTQATINSKMG